jgi:cellulose synthase/poly-beta-1,6-N-acetylglucosamine synthase-like glycosyltransferase
MLPSVSILVPHFQTPELTLLCLRLLRAKTRHYNYETIVVDNGSTDGSGSVLQQVRWITLLRRETTADERPARSHGLALNLGFQHAHAPLILTIHTDTMVLRNDWLDYLVNRIDHGGPRCGVVGAWKLEHSGPCRRSIKWLEEAWRAFRGRLSPSPPYIRSYCALYRREAIRARPQMLDPSDEHSAGEELHREIDRAGWLCDFVPPAELGRYVCHLNHATMALNRHFGRHDPYMPRTRARAIRRIERFFATIGADQILADAALDS